MNSFIQIILLIELNYTFQLMLMQNFFKINGTRTLLFSYEEKEVIHTTEKRGNKVVKHKHLQIIESNKMTLLDLL